MLLFEENWEKYHFLAVSVLMATTKRFIRQLPGFPPLICIHLHMSTNKKTGSATAETLIRRWPELKLRWGTQTLPWQYRIHKKTCTRFEVNSAIYRGAVSTRSIINFCLLCFL